MVKKRKIAAAKKTSSKSRTKKKSEAVKKMFDWDVAECIRDAMDGMEIVLLKGKYPLPRSHYEKLIELIGGGLYFTIKYCIRAPRHVCLVPRHGLVPRHVFI